MRFSRNKPKADDRKFLVVFADGSELGFGNLSSLQAAEDVVKWARDRGKSAQAFEVLGEINPMTCA